MRDVDINLGFVTQPPQNNNMTWILQGTLARNQPKGNFETCFQCVSATFKKYFKVTF